MQFSVGQVVGDYRVVDVIGSGGMGTVYKVQHVISDRIEAMKVILPGLINSPELAERFMREIRLQARLRHPNITSLYNALHSGGGNLLMVMEYVEGETLYDRLRASRLPPAESIYIVVQVLDALAHAHELGIIHRDIKPGNIMITRDGLVKVMDFGIARAADQNDVLTRTGTAVGSLHYMSPEQVQGTPVDHRSDLYSLGITLYELVTGQKPITGDSSFAIMTAQVNQIPTPPAAVNAAITPALSLAILKAIEKKPGERYQSANEFKRALEIARATEFPVPIATPVTPLPSSPVPLPTPSPISTSGSGSNSAIQHFEKADLDRVRKDLAVYVGPMARILVDRAAKKAQNLKQLYESLAPEVPEGQERKKFLAQRPR